ncbi:MAG: hypothetical protein ACJAWT_000086 [Glaciecola sp.]|jgi:hypothetical protein
MGPVQVMIFILKKKEIYMIRLIFCICLLSLSGCQSTVDNAYYGMWEKLGVEKRDILVDRVEDAQDSQKDAQEQFASALDEFSALINYDGGELEDVYTNLSDQLEVSKESAASVSQRIDKVEAVANALFVEWKNEIDIISSAKLKRDSQRKLAETKRKYASLLVSMRKVEKSMDPVLVALQDNVLALKHNLNANAIGALQGEFNSIKQDVGSLIKEMNAAITQSDDFIKSIKG